MGGLASRAGIRLPRTRQGMPLDVGRKSGIGSQRMDERTKQTLVLGREHYAKREYDKAEPLLREVLEHEDRFADIHDMLGVIAHSRGNFIAAEKHFERALAINPAYTEAALNLAVTYNDRGKYEKAREVYSRIQGSPGGLKSGLDPFATSISAGGRQVLCVNPAAPAGGSGALLTYLPVRGLRALGFGAAGTRAVSTPWIEYRDEYVAHCENSAGASWLQIDRPGGSADHRPAVTQFEGPNWGLHVYDVNLALGNLVSLVRSQAAAYGRD